MDPKHLKGSSTTFVGNICFAMKSQHKFLISQTGTLQFMHTQTIAFYFMLKIKVQKYKKFLHMIELFHVASFHILTLLLTLDHVHMETFV